MKQDATNATAANRYSLRKNMRPGLGSTLRKAMRARRIENGDRSEIIEPPAKHVQEREAFNPSRLTLSLIEAGMMRAAAENRPRKPKFETVGVAGSVKHRQPTMRGQERRYVSEPLTYITPIIRGKYTGELLRSIRADGKHR